MNSDWMSLANFTKVEIGAFGMHTLVTNTVDTFGASIASSKVTRARSIFRTNIINGILNLDECVMRVVFTRNAEARFASIVIRAVKTFEATATDPRIAEITSSIVNDRLLKDFHLYLSIRCAMQVSSSARCACSRPAMHCVNNDSSWYMYLEKLVERIVLFCSTRRDAGRAEVVIGTIQTFVPDTLGVCVARITENARVYDRRRDRWSRSRR